MSCQTFYNAPSECAVQLFATLTGSTERRIGAGIGAKTGTDPLEALASAVYAVMLASYAEPRFGVRSGEWSGELDLAVERVFIRGENTRNFLWYSTARGLRSRMV